MKVEIKSIVESLLLQYFADQKIVLEYSHVKEVDTLLDLKIVLPHENDSSLIRINPGSVILNEVVLDQCKSKTNFKSPESLDNVAFIIQEFGDKLKSDLKINKHNPFRPIMNGFYGYLLKMVKDSGIDVYSHAYKKIEVDSVDRFTDDFDQGFIFHLLTAGYSTKEIYNFCQVCTQSENHYIFRNLVQEIFRFPGLPYELYQFGNKNMELEQCEFQLRLMPKLFDQFPDEILTKTYSIIDHNRSNGIRVLAHCKLSNSQIDKALTTATNHVDDPSIGVQLDNLFYFLVGNENATAGQRVKAYNLWGQLLTNADDKLSLQIINSISLVDNEEDEPFRFNLLIQFLNKTGNFAVLKNFFYQFKSPQFVYKLLSDQYQLAKGRKSHVVRGLSQPLQHFFRTAPEESEKWILELFDPTYKLNTLPIEVMMLQLSNVFNVDLLKIKDEKTQLAAIKKFFYVTLDFEKLLPTLLTLWTSNFPEVVKSLQAHLSVLAYESYGQSMIDWIKPVVKGKGSKSFLNPIIEAAKAHEEEIKSKFSIKDINPMYHEKNMYELYAGLAHESQTKAMQESRNDPGFLMSMFKNSIIVRGNSCRVGGCGSKIVPLGTVSVSSTIDTRMYKNPELFEFSQRNIE